MKLPVHGRCSTGKICLISVAHSSSMRAMYIYIVSVSSTPRNSRRTLPLLYSPPGRPASCHWQCVTGSAACVCHSASARQGVRTQHGSLVGTPSARPSVVIVSVRALSCQWRDTLLGNFILNLAAN